MAVVIATSLLFKYKMRFHTTLNIFSVLTLSAHVNMRPHTQTHTRTRTCGRISQKWYRHPSFIGEKS